MMTFKTYAQDLNQYKWTNRVIILVSDDQSTDLLTEQLKELKSDAQGLDERRIIVYRVTKSSWIKGLNNSKENNGSSLYNNLNPKNDFEFILIGLDGGVKMRETAIVSIEMLFQTIDSMPMRRNELDKKNNKHR